MLHVLQGVAARNSRRILGGINLVFAIVVDAVSVQQADGVHPLTTIQSELQSPVWERSINLVGTNHPPRASLNTSDRYSSSVVKTEYETLFRPKDDQGTAL